MYESEANNKKESWEQIPAEVRARFAELKDSIRERTVLPWSEHCTECVWPTCYTTCDLYSPRRDGRCRRFTDGMVRIDCPEALNSYLLKIRFKQWGKLWTPGNIHLRSLAEASRIERRDQWIGATLVQLPSPVQTFASQKRYSFKKRMTYRSAAGETSPNVFVVECYNPSSSPIRLSLTMRSVDPAVKIPFQQLLTVDPGFNRERVRCQDISRFLNLRSAFNVELVPNEDQAETTLYFGVMEFVREVVAGTEATVDKLPPVGSKLESKSEEVTAVKPGKESNEARKVKCVVWDLDHTLWDGILVEDGAANLKLKPQISHLLKTLDERGILLSIASKNNRDEALAVLRQFGLEEYFLCPQISWQPKSQGIAAIAQQLNIGVDTLLFVDDSEFELQQVQAVHPEVRVLPANRYLEIADLEICQVPVSAESRERRRMYQVESQRQNIAESFADDYLAFLRHCDIRLNISPMTKENLTRVHELTQRTNQMNFSGNRYARNVLERILSDSHLDTYVLEVEDRFGSYGVVGFAIVDNRVPLLTDLMFSCRVQSKKVEHAFLGYLIRKYIGITGKDFYANYRKTPRNAPSGKVFSDLMLEELSVDENGVSRLLFPRDREMADDGIIRLMVQDLVQDPVETAG